MTASTSWSESWTRMVKRPSASAASASRSARSAGCNDDHMAVELFESASVTSVTSIARSISSRRLYCWTSSRTRIVQGKRPSRPSELHRTLDRREELHRS